MTSQAPADYQISLKRQLQFLQWLQSAEGAIAGGATNSWNGRYEIPPAGTPTFFGMAYTFEPVYYDPPSNNWFGFQSWNMERVAEYVYVSKDTQAMALLQRWVLWVIPLIQINDTSIQVPSTLNWTGMPSQSFSDPDNWYTTINSNLHVSVVDYSTDVGVIGSLARVLIYYAAATNDATSKGLAKNMLDILWHSYRDSLGFSAPESRADYTRFNDPVYLPPGWTGTFPYGQISANNNPTFLSIRPHLQNEPDKIELQPILNALASKTVPVLNYHRFWAQVEIAVAFAEYQMLLATPTTMPALTTPAPAPETDPAPISVQTPISVPVTTTASSCPCALKYIVFDNVNIDGQITFNGVKINGRIEFIYAEQTSIEASPETIP
jgi:hypothetical protein